MHPFVQPLLHMLFGPGTVLDLEDTETRNSLYYKAQE